MKLPCVYLLSSFALAALTGRATPDNTAPSPITQTNYIAGNPIELNDNGAWSWFMDPRVIIDRDQLLVGSDRAVGRYTNSAAPDWGNVELSILDLKSLKHQNVVLHRHLEQDDHDAPGLMVLQDGRYFAGYSKHGQETKMYYRISTRPGDATEWEPEATFVTPGKAASFTRDVFTYCNPMRLSTENNRMYLFHRSHNLNPNYLVSEDDGRTFRYGGKLFDGLHGYSAYVKYACNGRDTIHFVATEDHPRNYPNSLYYAFIRGGNIYRADNSLVAPLAASTNTTVHPWDFTRIYQGGSNHVAWMSDIRLDAQGRPAVLFTVKVNSAGTTRGHGGEDIRFHYARFDGQQWHEKEIGYAGLRLYAGEDDYTGLGAIDPQNVNVIYVSTDATITGEPLISRADGQRHHELYKGVTSDGGATFKWSQVTANSTVDNLRPLVPIWKDKRTALVWLRGGYYNNHGEWTTKVMADLLSPGDVR